MFPRDSKYLLDEQKIHYTMRIMPEDQNTGGFYVALLRKNKRIMFKKSIGRRLSARPREAAGEARIRGGRGPCLR
jgi:hypothetical protein